VLDRKKLWNALIFRAGGMVDTRYYAWSTIHRQTVEKRS
jgi:hypothetical protein